MVMEETYIGIALAAEEFDFTLHLAVALIRGKTSVVVLNIPGGDRHIPGDLNKIFVIPAMGTDNSSQGAPRGQLHFLHSSFSPLVNPVQGKIQ